MNPGKLLLFLLVGLFACQPQPQDAVTPDGQDPEQVGNPTGTPTEVGKHMGSPISKMIGPTGGTLATSDGRLLFTFPAGAVSKETVITLQPVENKAFGGAGLGYELIPKGLKLANEAEVTWHYTPEEIEGSAPEALGVAYQDENGIWQGRTDLTVDKVKQIVKAPVSHLAHWSFYEQFFIKSTKSALAPAEQATVTAYYQHTRQDERPNPTNSDLDLLVPLTPVQVLSASRVIRWTINGMTDGAGKGNNYGSVGQITEDRTYAKATYDAPAREPDTNPVAVGVEVDVKQYGRVILACPIRVASKSSFSLGGFTENNPNVLLTYSAQNKQLQGALTDKMGGKVLTFIINNFHGEGTYEVDEASTITLIGRTEGIPYAPGYYPPGSPTWVSGGGKIKITQYKSSSSVIVGTMSGKLFRAKSLSEIESISSSGKFEGMSVVIQ